MAELEDPRNNVHNENEDFLMNNTAVLENRVTGLERGQSDIVVTLKHLRERFDDQFLTLGKQITDGHRAPWSLLLGCFLATFSLLGALGMLYSQPVKEHQAIQDKAIELLGSQQVPRAEHVERWRLSDRELDYIKATSAERYKSILDQIDDIRRQYRDIYGAADIIRDLNSRLKNIEASGVNRAASWEARSEQRR